MPGLKQQAPRRWAFEASSETVLLVCSLFWAAACNGPFLGAAMEGRSLQSVGAWGFGAALFVGLAALHFALVAPFAPRPLLKPLLALLIVVTAFSLYYIRRYGVYLDPTMLRNVLRTDVHEARELLTPALLPHLALYAVLPLVLLWRVRLRPRPLGRALLRRLLGIALAVALLVGAVVSAYQPLASLMRNHKELRYLITPANVLWSLADIGLRDAKTAAGPKRAIGLDAKPGPRMAARTRPLVVVFVVGETARAANWGLSGYARPTTPELASLGVINFADVTSCGTNTEVSVPCLFAPVGRRDYDEATIRGSESLLHVLARAGVGVRWRDNQSGCKGVCDGLPAENVTDIAPAGTCTDGRCPDEALLTGLDDWLAGVKGTQLLVLHQLGNHGPSYFRRYPPAFERFTPACRNDDLQRCTQQEITNAYDNALLYTDHVLAQLVRRLDAASGQVDSALVYVSDHGESLGEKGLFLHGIPYAIAPDVQKKVPMVWWLSKGLPAAAGIDEACLRQRARQPAQHDHLFHSLLGLLDVQTALREAPWDLTHDCRSR